MRNKGFKRGIIAIFIILTILLSAIMVIDSVSAGDNPPKGYETYYMRGYGFNVPTSYKLVDEGWDEVNRLNYMNFQKGKHYVNISLERHSNSFNKNVMDGFSSFKLNDEKLYKTSISGITGFYNKRNKVKTFVFASEDDMIYLHVKGPKVSKVVSSITQRDYKPYHSNEYDFDDAYYESDAYDDSFDDSFDDASYYNYRW
jgi:hypothetical protein